MTERASNIVVCGIIERAGKVFLARRAMSKKTYPGTLEVAGGHVEPGESLEAALHRELMEEFSIDVTVGPIVDAFTYDSENMFKVEIIYLCHIADDVEPILDPENHSEGIWIDASGLSELDGNDPEAAAVKKYFGSVKGSDDEQMEKGGNDE